MYLGALRHLPKIWSNTVVCVQWYVRQWEWWRDGWVPWFSWSPFNDPESAAVGLSDGLLAHSAQPAKLCHSTQQWGATELASEREAIKDHLTPERYRLGRVPETKVALITNIRITRLSHEAEGNLVHWKKSLELIQWTVKLEHIFKYLCFVISSSL